MDDKGFVFTMDVLLSIIVITVAMGMAINQFDFLNAQTQDFVGRQSLEVITSDAADYLVKTPGNPIDWNNYPHDSSILPGLSYMSAVGPNNNFLNPKKIKALDQNPQLLQNLVNTTNYELNLYNAKDNSLLLNISSPNPSTAMGNAKEIAVANRTVVVLTNMTLVHLNDLSHINPANPGNDNGHLWYNKSGDSDYVGPGNVTTNESENSSFYVDKDKIGTSDGYDYYIYIDENYATQGSPINVIKYGFTDGNAVVNGTYGDLSDKSRDDAITRELNDVYNPGGWQSLDTTDTGSLNNINEDIREALEHYNENTGYLKMWISVKSNPKSVTSISLIQVYHGDGPFQRIPAKLVLKVWE